MDRISKENENSCGRFFGFSFSHITFIFGANILGFMEVMKTFSGFKVCVFEILFRGSLRSGERL